MHFGKCLAAVCLLTAPTAIANAAPDYDPALEEAAIRIVAARLGPLRDGFGQDERPRFFTPAIDNGPSLNADATGWQDGLAPATDLPRPPTGQP